MKKFSKKSVVVFVGVMAVCAFVMPSMASALVWGPVGNTSVLHSSNLTFTVDPQPNAGWSCASSTFNVTVASAALEVTATTFTNCMGFVAGNNCTVTATGHSFPWTATPTNPIQIHGVNVTVRFENTPGNPTACPIPATHVTLTGTLTGGTWSNVEHGATFLGATGLSLDPPGSSLTVSGTIQDLVAPFVTLS